MLKEQHREIVRELDGLQRSLSRKEQDPRQLCDLIGILAAKMEIHFAHEEEAVYKPLDSLLKEHSPTGELIDDHRSIRMKFGNLRSMSAGQEGEGGSASDLGSQLRLLRSDLRKHLAKEETVIFWLAEYHLSRSEKFLKS